MNNTYKNIKEYAFGEHTDAFIKVLEVFNDLSIKFFLIGAQARDVHFYQIGIRIIRKTRDIDFAVMVESKNHYQELMDALLNKGFKPTELPYRILWDNDDTIIDILPFGQLEEDHSISFDERGIELSVLGFKELNDELKEFYLDEDNSVSIPVPPLHGLFILKLLSWDDKKPARKKDLSDMNQILHNYWDFVEDEAYRKHQDLLDDDDFQIIVAAARILGRHLKSTLSKSNVLKEKIVEILDKQAKATDSPGPMLKVFAEEKNKSVEEIKTLLDAILTGIKE